MQKSYEFSIDPSLLTAAVAPSDRFVYTPTFAIYDPFSGGPIAVLPAHQLDHVAYLAALLPDSAAKTKLLERYAGLPELVERIEDWLGEQAPDEQTPSETELLELTKRHVEELSTAVEKVGGTVNKRALERITKRLEETSSTVSALTAVTHPELRPAPAAIGGLIDAGAHAGNGTGASTAVAERSLVAVRGPAVVTPRRGLPAAIVRASAGLTTKAPPQTATVPGEEQLAAIAQSELGFMFLDRTRIRPVGFALGEHLHSLGLAPGEEVTLEEHTYSKRETSFERASEQELSIDTEMSSTYTTELNEGMDTERSRTFADTDTMGLNVGGTVEGVSFNVGPTTSTSLTDADKVASRVAVKKSQTASAKVAAKHRSQHKTVFKISTESRFETTAKRTLRNPNVNTPIDLQYFKVMQRLQLAQERYGVRLCWAPSVKAPGGSLQARLQKKHDEIYARVAEAGAGPKPLPPTPPGSSAPAPKVVTNSQVADRWDPVWGNQRYDYRLTFAAPADMEWDGDKNFVTASLQFTFTGKRPAGANVVNVLPNGVGVDVLVHVGVADCTNPFEPQFWEPRGSASFTVGVRFRASAVTGADAAYNQALAQWQSAMEQWEQADREAKEEAKQKADEEWAAYVQAGVQKANPMHETIGAIVHGSFPSTFRDDVWEVDFWEDLFDWKNAALRLYPSWWSDDELRDPDGSPYSFLNASWARLYLPIRPGSEALALRWIYQRTFAGKASAEVEKMITQVTKDLADYRKTSFGDPEEVKIEPAPDGGCPKVTDKFLCLARWEDVLPTDGTHLEVMQSTSSAADADSRKQLDDGAALRTQQIEQTRLENVLLDGAAKKGGSVQTAVNVNIGEEPESL